ncbi:MAG: hypothetical protein KF729_28615 [Sandaracinaceae bacterium]|nr:hypothetical protein [Sandaracinaceae bacterium]
MTVPAAPARGSVRYLLVACAWFALLGLVVAVAGTSALFEPYTAAMAQRFFGAPSLPADVVPFTAFLFGPIGGSIAGKWVAAGAVVWGGLAQRERWAWHASVAGLASWFVIDSGMSIVHGAYFNVLMINLVPLALFGAPLFFARRPVEGSGRPPPTPAHRAAFHHWLMGASVAFALLGAVLTVAPGTFVLALWESMAATHFFGLDSLPPPVRPLEAFLFAPLGGTITGQFVLIAYLAAFPVRRGERWGLAAIAISLATWFVIDSSVCAFHGAWFNVLTVNVMTIAVMAPPLAALWASSRAPSA